MKERFKSLTESTFVPLSIVFVIGTIIWAAGHYAFQTDANARAIEELQKKQDDVSTIQTDVAVLKQAVSGIQQQLDRIEKKL